MYHYTYSRMLSLSENKEKEGVFTDLGRTAAPRFCKIWRANKKARARLYVKSKKARKFHPT